MLTEAQTARYLRRIGVGGGVGVSLDDLARLQRQHLMRIPYENLDLLNGVPLSLEPAALYRKLVERERGGYCFELQGLFRELLRALGYRVSQYAGRFMDEPGRVQMRRHRVLVVDLGGERHVCDVGVRGESPRCPLRLAADAVQSDGLCRYRYARDAFYGWVLWQQLPGADGWRPMLGFTEEPQIDDDYVMPSFFCERHPDSTFNKYMKVSRFTAGGNVAVVGNAVKVYAAGALQSRRELRGHADALAVLRDSFGLRVPEEYRLLTDTASGSVAREGKLTR